MASKVNSIFKTLLTVSFVWAAAVAVYSQYYYVENNLKNIGILVLQVSFILAISLKFLFTIYNDAASVWVSNRGQRPPLHLLDITLSLVTLYSTFVFFTVNYELLLKNTEYSALYNFGLSDYREVNSKLVQVMSLTSFYFGAIWLHLSRAQRQMRELEATSGASYSNLLTESMRDKAGPTGWFLFVSVRVATIIVFLYYQRSILVSTNLQFDYAAFNFSIGVYDYFFSVAAQPLFNALLFVFLLLIWDGLIYFTLVHNRRVTAQIKSTCLKFTILHAVTFVFLVFMAVIVFIGKVTANEFALFSNATVLKFYLVLSLAFTLLLVWLPMEDSK